MIFDFSSRGTISKNGKAPILESPIEDGIISFVYESHLKKNQTKKLAKMDTTQCP